MYATKNKANKAKKYSSSLQHNKSSSLLDKIIENNHKTINKIASL
jgi:hypothetical protein